VDVDGSESEGAVGHVLVFSGLVQHAQSRPVDPHHNVGISVEYPGPVLVRRVRNAEKAVVSTEYGLGVLIEDLFREERIEIDRDDRESFDPLIRSSVYDTALDACIGHVDGTGRKVDAMFTGNLLRSMDGVNESRLKVQLLV
jgi:hypothetical protein